MGKTKRLIDELIYLKAKGNSFQVLNVQMKLLLKGIDVKKISADTPDDAATIDRIYQIAKDFQVTLPTL